MLLSLNYRWRNWYTKRLAQGHTATKKSETRFQFSEANWRFQLLRFLNSILTSRRDLKKGRKWLGRDMPRENLLSWRKTARNDLSNPSSLPCSHIFSSSETRPLQHPIWGIQPFRDKISLTTLLTHKIYKSFLLLFPRLILKELIW